MIDLGFMNSWEFDHDTGKLKLPKKLQKCRDKKHQMHFKKIGHPSSGMIEHYCEICKISYKIDSSG